jgi:RNA polymerase sigma-70 factor (ECF subfamily)
LLSNDRRITREWAENLYDRYGERLYRQALMILWDCGLAEDAMHQVFVKLLNQRGGADEVASWEEYLTRAVRNECYRVLRRRKRLPAQPSSEGQILEAADAMGGDEQERQKLERALGQLGAEQREVIQLKVYEGMTFRQVAEAIGISVNTAASRYRYAIDRLRSCLLINRQGNRDEF